MADKTELICICCPIGCAMTVEQSESGIKVAGNTCKRGEKYAIAEVTAPTRTVTSSVKINGGEIARVPVKTAAPIPKDKIFVALDEIKKVELDAPVEIGDVIVKNVAGSGADVVATRKVERINNV